MAVLAIEFVRLPDLGQARANAVRQYRHQPDLDLTDQRAARHVSRAGKRFAIQGFVPSNRLTVHTGEEVPSNRPRCVEGVGAAEAGTDQVVDFQPQILAACKALTVLDAAKIGQRLLRQRFQGTGMSRVLFHDRNASRFPVSVKPPDVAAVYGLSPKSGLYRACREDVL